MTLFMGTQEGSEIKRSRGPGDDSAVNSTDGSCRTQLNFRHPCGDPQPPATAVLGYLTSSSGLMDSHMGIALKARTHIHTHTSHGTAASAVLGALLASLLRVVIGPCTMRKKQ